MQAGGVKIDVGSDCGTASEGLGHHETVGYGGQDARSATGPPTYDGSGTTDAVNCVKAK